MESSALFSLPLPFIVSGLSLALLIMIAKTSLPLGRGRLFFCAAFLIFLVGSAVVGLRFAYGFEAFIRLQRILPFLIGPCLYLGFLSYFLDKKKFVHQVIIHLLLAFSAILLSTQLRALIDLAISISYLVYCLLLFHLWYQGEDKLVEPILEITYTLHHWTLRATLFLLMLLLLDTIIALDFMLNLGENADIFISLGSTLEIVLFIGLIIFLPQQLPRSKTQTSKTPTSDTHNKALCKKADQYLQESQLFLDSGLTIVRLARRLNLTTRELSSAINHTYGINISQYVNNFRVEYAAEKLKTSDASISTIMEESGFTTRSNFYREFKRIYRQNPGEFRKS